MHTEIALLVLENYSLDVWDEIQRVTGRKDEYHGREFICNGCRFIKNCRLGY
jgi:hypothetical protein